jgi:hypothetical protein
MSWLVAAGRAWLVLPRPVEAGRDSRVEACPVSAGTEGAEFSPGYTGKLHLNESSGHGFVRPAGQAWLVRARLGQAGKRCRAAYRSGRAWSGR